MSKPPPKDSPPVIQDPTGVYVKVPVTQEVLDLGAQITNAFDAISQLAKSYQKVHKRLTGKKLRARRSR